MDKKCIFYALVADGSREKKIVCRHDGVSKIWVSGCAYPSEPNNVSVSIHIELKNGGRHHYSVSTNITNYEEEFNCLIDKCNSFLSSLL